MSKHATGDQSLAIAEDLLDAINASSEVATAQDPESYQGMDRAYFRVTGPDGETYYVQVSKSAPTPNPAPAPGVSYPDAQLADPTQDFSKFDAFGNPR